MSGLTQARRYRDNQKELAERYIQRLWASLSTSQRSDMRILLRAVYATAVCDAAAIRAKNMKLFESYDEDESI